MSLLTGGHFPVRLGADELRGDKVGFCFILNWFVIWNILPIYAPFGMKKIHLHCFQSEDLKSFLWTVSFKAHASTSSLSRRCSNDDTSASPISPVSCVSRVETSLKQPLLHSSGEESFIMVPHGLQSFTLSLFFFTIFGKVAKIMYSLHSWMLHDDLG